MRETHNKNRGFTLIELSIVLVVIGLIAGGVLVGQDLIGSAGARATVSQVEQFNADANAFYSKYNALPGDINGSMAVQQYGLRNSDGYRNAYGGLPGMGDQNGIIEGIGNPQYPGPSNGMNQSGETAYFWQDLASVYGTPISQTTCPGYPEAKVGNGNCFFVWSGGVSGGNSINYYDLSVYVNLSGYGRCSSCLASNPGLTVSQARAIDTKIDDGLPQSGNVKALYLSADNQGNQYIAWAGVGTANQGGIRASSDAGYTTATSGSLTTCFDNGGGSGPQQYSMEQNNGSGPNCALSFKMQGAAR